MVSFERGFHSGTQADLKLEIFLPHECWDYSYIPPCLAQMILGDLPAHRKGNRFPEYLYHMFLEIARLRLFLDSGRCRRLNL
jgi:hypothetical protein